MSKLVNEINANPKAKALAMNRGYHGFFATPDDIKTAYDLLVNNVNLLPQGHKQGIGVQLQCFVNTMACVTAINDNDLYTMIEEGRLEDAQAHVATIRNSIPAVEEENNNGTE